MSARRHLLAAVAAVLFAAGACTTSTWDTSEINDTTPTTAKRYPLTEAGITASLSDYLSAVGSDLDEWAAPKDQAQCAATRLVRRLTVDHLVEAGYDPQAPSLALSWSEDDRTAVVNILGGCIDISDAILETYSSYLKLPLGQSNCMAKGFDRLDLSRDLITALVDGKEPDPFANSDRYASGLAQLAVECMGKDDLLPNAPMPPLGPLGDRTTTSTTTTTTSLAADDGLAGVEPGSPLDTTTTTGN